MKTFIEHVAATGSVGDFADRLALLILPRPTEAIEMKDDAGEQVENDEEGYEIKREQVLAKIRTLVSMICRFYSSMRSPGRRARSSPT